MLHLFYFNYIRLMAKQKALCDISLWRYIGFSAHFRHLFIQFHQFPIQFRPEKLTAFKSKVQFRQIVIHIRFC